MKQRSLQFTDYIVRQKLAYAAWTRFERLQCFKYIYIFIHQNGSQKKKKNTYIQKYTTSRNGSRNKE